MKTIQNNKTLEVKRVTDSIAEKMIKQNWKYVPKCTFKSTKELVLKFEPKPEGSKKHGNK